MIVRIVLALGVAGVLAGLALDMSGRAPRTAGSNHVAPVVFIANIPPRGVLCQPTAPLPPDAARVVMTIGTYGHPIPPGAVRFISPTGALSAQGQLPSGAVEGVISVPLKRFRAVAPASEACVQNAGRSKVALAGESGGAGPASEQVNGRPGGGLVSLGYVRAGSESWWDLVPTLVERFGRGKAAFFGDWTLPVSAALLIGLWVGTIRLLTRELT